MKGAITIKVISKKVSIVLMIFILVFTSSNIKINAQDIQKNYTKELAIQKLQELGMTTSEIETLNDEELKIFYYAKDFSVDKQYYYVPEDNSKTAVVIDEITMINAIAEEKFSSNPMYDISPYISDTVVSSGGYLEQYVYIADAFSYPGQYYVAYKANWLKQPLNRKTDVFGVAVSNATVIPGTASASYSWIMSRNYNGNYNPNWASGTVNLASNFKIDSHGVATKFNLVNDTLDMVQQARTQRVEMAFRVTKDNASIKTIGVSGNYLHQEATFAVSPSITAISFSVGISITFSNKFTEMLPNPYTVLSN